MSIRTRLGKLEQRAQVHYEVLVLPDGSSIRYPDEDAFEALAALLSGETHWLLPHLRQAQPKVGLVGLVWALEGEARVS